jgi:hypothetical protein
MHGVSSIGDLCQDCLGCGIITGDDEEDQCDRETVTSLARAETALELSIPLCTQHWWA